MAAPGVFSGHNVMAHYAPSKNAIELNRDAFNSIRFTDAQKAQCILHETIHAVTCWAIAQYKNASKEERAKMGALATACEDILSVYKSINTDEFRSLLQVNSTLGDNAFYGLSDEYEMLAELANPAFRTALKAKNLWRQLINGIKKILGFDVTESGEGKTNALEVLDNALETILNNFDPVAYRFYQSSPTKTVHENAAMSTSLSEFNATRDRAIKERGIVIPGLAEMEFPITEVTPFPFRNSYTETFNEIIRPFIENMEKDGDYLVTDSNGKKVRLVLNGKSLRKFKHTSSFREDLPNKPFRASRRVYFAVFNNFQEVLKGLREVEIHPDYSKDEKGKRSLDNNISDNTIVHRYFGAVRISGEEPVRIELTVYEFSRDNDPIMYSQEVTKIELSSINNSSILGSERTDGTEAPGTLAGAKLLQNIEKSYDEGKKILDESKKASEEASQVDSEDDIFCRPVTDQETLDQLNSEPTIKVYRAMQMIDGKLYPPMSAKVKGKLREPTELNVWEEAEENPSLVDSKGKFVLNKGNGSSISAAYNPYIHTSRSPINDQFSSAWNRPELVTVEVEVPASTLEGKYKAEKAKDSVGEKTWKSGPIGRLLAKLGEARRVILSRYATNC